MNAKRGEALGRLEFEVGVLIRRARRAIQERAQIVHPDLAPASYLILMHLDSVGPCRASVLVELFSMDKGAVSRQAQQLIELGLMERTVDPDDRRAQLLALTDDARTRLARVQAQRRERFDQRLADWSQQDLERMAADLTRYNQSLEASAALARS